MMSAAKGMLGKLPVLSPWKWALLLGAVLAAYQMKAMHLDDRLYFWITTSWHQDDWAKRSLWLPEYRVEVDAKPVVGVSDNFSGLSYDDDRHQIWAVLNNPEQLLRLSVDGEVLGRYPLHGFQDVEGVTYLGDDLLLLAEERKHALVAVSVPHHEGTLQRADYRALTLGIDLSGNQGFEGLGYDRAGDRLFVVKEHSPRKLYEIRGLKRSLQGEFGLEVIDRQDWIDHRIFASDLSSVHFDERTGHLVLLSDESRLLIELGKDGQLISFRSLLRGFAGLRGSVPQAEGVTFDAQGNLYLASEPNLFYRLQRQ
ncbi:SdiA-regulated domain-containing protein [Ectopseudomonas toyotomiensis]|uniref:SdiA-regulated domain-containing protein n=1 Tax=Ectopseudomonas toyotomiensis TaxID=554344 RepID=UPI0037C849A1